MPVHRGRPRSHPGGPLRIPSFRCESGAGLVPSDQRATRPSALVRARRRESAPHSVPATCSAEARGARRSAEGRRRYGKSARTKMPITGARPSTRRSGCIRPRMAGRMLVVHSHAPRATGSPMSNACDAGDAPPGSKRRRGLRKATWLVIIRSVAFAAPAPVDSVQAALSVGVDVLWIIGAVTSVVWFMSRPASVRVDHTCSGSLGSHLDLRLVAGAAGSTRCHRHRTPVRPPDDGLRPFRRRHGEWSNQVAERVGFEPTRLSPGGFQDRCHQPLGHLSGSRECTVRGGSGPASDIGY